MTRASLHELLDALPEDRLVEAGRFLAGLTDDPFVRALAQAAEDDELVTPEQAALLDRRRQAAARGYIVSDEEAARRLGL